MATRIGFFICECGPNIAEGVDIDEVLNAVDGMEDVVVAARFTSPVSRPRACDRLWRMAATWGASRGSWATTVMLAWAGRRPRLLSKEITLSNRARLLMPS